MADISAEQFAQTAFDLDLFDEWQLRQIWAELGTRDVEFDTLKKLLLRRELLTNYQIEKILKGERTGFFYGRYKVLYLVGTGTFSRVYRAVDLDSDKTVAVKVLRRRYSDDPEQTSQFQTEGLIGTKLRHPNIVTVYEIAENGRQHYMVMDFIEGQTLRDFLKIRGKFEPLEATKLISDVSAGLAYAAQHGISHRDIKLSNVLVSSRGQAKLVDFGLAGAGHNDQMSDEAIADLTNPRTIDYAGLERATGTRKDDVRSDLYFVGCMYYHLLTGKSPLHETKARTERLNKSRFLDVVPISQADPSLPLLVAHIVHKSMELDVEKRYQSPVEMLGDLRIATERLAAGDSTSVAETEADAEQLEQELNQHRDKVLPQRNGGTLMFVESNTRMQDLFRQQLKDFGYRVLVTMDPDRAFSRFEANEQGADCLIFSSKGLGENALKAFNRCADSEHTERINAVLLLDAKHSGWKSQAKVDKHRVVVTMPVKLKRFQRLLDHLMTTK